MSELFYPTFDGIVVNLLKPYIIPAMLIVGAVVFRSLAAFFCALLFGVVRLRVHICTNVSCGLLILLLKWPVNLMRSALQKYHRLLVAQLHMLEYLHIGK